jgi:hypothetical protein
VRIIRLNSQRGIIHVTKFLLGVCGTTGAANVI